MSREEQIAFLKSIKKTRIIRLNEKEEKIYDEIHLIADDAQLKLLNQYLRRRNKMIITILINVVFVVSLIML